MMLTTAPQDLAPGQFVAMYQHFTEVLVNPRYVLECPDSLHVFLWNCACLLDPSIATEESEFTASLPGASLQAKSWLFLQSTLMPDASNLVHAARRGVMECSRNFIDISRRTDLVDLVPITSPEYEEWCMTLAALGLHNDRMNWPRAARCMLAARVGVSGESSASTVKAWGLEDPDVMKTLMHGNGAYFEEIKDLPAVTPYRQDLAWHALQNPGGLDLLTFNPACFEGVDLDDIAQGLTAVVDSFDAIEHAFAHLGNEFVESTKVRAVQSVLRVDA